MIKGELYLVSLSNSVHVLLNIEICYNIFVRSFKVQIFLLARTDHFFSAVSISESKIWWTSMRTIFFRRALTQICPSIASPLISRNIIQILLTLRAYSKTVRCFQFVFSIKSFSIKTEILNFF